MNNRKITAGILVFIFLSGILLTGFTYQQGIGNVFIERNSEIYHNTTYHEQIAGHNTQGIERTYFVKADIQNTDLKPYVFEGEVTGTYTMDTMIKTLEDQGYKVLAGINGDLYDTKSGTPKGLTIHDYKIKTSGYAPEYVISFNEESVATLEKVNLRYTVKGTINAPVINLPPVIGPKDPIDPIDPIEPIELEEEVIQPKEDVIEEPVIEAPVVYVPTDYSADIGYFNVPFGGSSALHLYNRQYASSTKTTTTSVEVILDAGSAEKAELEVGGTITATVVEVRNGNFNTPISDSQLVLSTVGNSSHAIQLSQLIPGSEVELTVSDMSNGNLLKSKEAIGVNNVLYDNNQFISVGTKVGPKTLIGIKPEGSLILYVLDGRQPGFSEGLGLTDVAKHLVDLGCSTVVAMDGGGSSVINVREGGIDSKAVMKSSPSDKVQRRTTNGLLLVYDTRGNSSPVNLHTYPSNSLVMPGADVQLKTYASDDKFEQVPMKNNVKYNFDSSSGNSINETGLFTAGSTIGTVMIEAKSEELSTTSKVDIQKDITFTINVKKLEIDPEKTFDIDVTAKYGLAPIASKDSLFTWTCDPIIGTIDENGLFQATKETGISGNIYVGYNGEQKTIPVQVGAAMIDFADTKEHWARYDIGKLAAKGIVNGMGDNLYMPDDFLTRAQFLTMLANTISGLDVTQATPAEFADVLSTEWYYNNVNWGFEAGIVSGMNDTTFAPNDKITREQMASMLAKFTNKFDLVLPETNSGATFTDSKKISPWATESVNKIVFAGIMNGYPEGSYKPQGSATRAEAASVIYKLITIRDNNKTE